MSSFTPGSGRDSDAAATVTERPCSATNPHESHVYWLGGNVEGAGRSYHCPGVSSAATATDAEWERLVERLTAIGQGHLADRTITPWEARVLLGRIGSLQVWALGALAKEVNSRVS